MSEKRRLTISEVKEVVEYCKNYGTHSYKQIDNYSYGIDDVYNQYLDMHDITMGMLDDLILKRNR